MRGRKQLMASARTENDRAEGSTDDWSTPAPLYDALHEEFGFTLDPCASPWNAKAPYFSLEDGVDGLEQDWGGEGAVVFVNFPYSQAKAWAAKCLAEADKGAIVVVLCAARTDTGWWQSLADYARDVRFIKGRLSFIRASGESTGAPFPSTVIVLDPSKRFDAQLTLWTLSTELRGRGRR